MNDATSGALPSSDDLEQTLQRLVRRVAMLMQAEKCVFLLHDRERDLLVARRPALGVPLPELRLLRLPFSLNANGQPHGQPGGQPGGQPSLSERSFASGEPEVVEDISAQEASDQVWLKRLDARNGIVYPLFVERLDEASRVADRVPVGLLLVLNKRGAPSFTPDDVRMLSSMARQVAAVIADAQTYLSLTEEKEQLAATFQSVLAAMVMIDASGHISLINPAAAHIFHLDDAEAVGRSYEEVLGESGVAEMFRDTLGSNEPQTRELEITTQPETYDGSQPRIFQAQTAFVHGERDGVPVVIGAVAILNDITDIRNVERMKTSFVSTVSHELRPPLA